VDAAVKVTFLITCRTISNYSWISGTSWKWLSCSCDFILGNKGKL